MKYETDSIAVSVDAVSEEGRTEIKISTVVKDQEVFPRLNTGNKKVMARILDVIANQQQSLLSSRDLWLEQPQANKALMLHVVCDACGHQFETEAPCCGEKRKRVICPNCNKPLVLRFGK